MTSVRGLLLILAVTIAAAVIPTRLASAWQQNEARDHDDFAVFYDSAQCLFTQDCPAYALRDRRAPNLAPPHAHVLLLPVLLLPVTAAYWAWIGLSIAAVAVSAWMAFRAAGRRPMSLAWLLLFLSMLCGSSLMTGLVASGQLYAVLTPLLVLAWIFWRRSRFDLAGLTIGIAASIKVLLLLPLLWFLINRHRRPALMLVGAFLGMMGLGVLAFGPETYRAWLEVLAGADRSGHFRDGSVFSALVRTFTTTNYFARTFDAPALLIPLWSVAAGFVIAITVLRPSDPDRTWLGLLAAALIASPKGWTYAGWWLLFPAISVAAAGTRTTRWLLLAAALLVWLPGDAPRWGQPNPWLTPTWGSLPLLIWLLCWTAAGIRPTAHPSTARGT